MAQEFLPLCDVLFNIISLALYFCDIVFDAVTAYSLYEKELYVWSVLSLVFIVCSLWLSQLLSLWWYLHTRKDNNNRSSTWRKTSMVITIHVLHCGILWRYFKLFIPVDFRYVKYEVRDLCLLRIVHAFCEAAPMLLLQLYLIWCKESINDVTDLNLVSTLLSLLAVCWSVASFSKYIRQRNVHRLVLTWLGVIFQFVWRLGTISSRTVVLSVYATVYTYWVFLVMGLHWISMFLWTISPKNIFQLEKMSRVKKCFYSMLISFIYIFCYVNLEEKDAKKKIIVFYVTMFMENALLVAVWLIGIGDKQVWYKELVSIFTFSSFCTGIIFMLLYYRYFHVKRLKYATSSKHSSEDVTKQEAGTTSSEQTLEKHPSNGLSHPRVNGYHQHFNGSIPPYVPGVFNCRFNPAIKRKKKKPTSFVPLPVPIMPSVGPRFHQVLPLGKMSEPFWKTNKRLIPLMKLQPITVTTTAGSSENESSVGSRVNIQQKLQEKKEQQLAKLRIIEEEIQQGKLSRPDPSDISECGTLRQPIPHAKKQPWVRHVEPPNVPYVLPPLCKQRSRTPEILLSPHYLENSRVYYDPNCWDSRYSDEEHNFSSVSQQKYFNGNRTCRMPSDLESQVSIPRSFTLPREFRYYRSRSRKTVRPEHFVASTNSSDGDVDSAEDEGSTLTRSGGNRSGPSPHHFHQHRNVRNRIPQNIYGPASRRKKLHETKL